MIDQNKAGKKLKIIYLLIEYVYIYIGEQRVTWTQSSMKMQSEIMNLFSKLIDPTGSTGNTCKKIIISFPQSKGKTFRDS